MARIQLNFDIDFKSFITKKYSYSWWLTRKGMCSNWLRLKNSKATEKLIYYVFRLRSEIVKSWLSKECMLFFRDIWYVFTVVFIKNNLKIAEKILNIYIFIYRVFQKKVRFRFSSKKP